MVVCQSQSSLVKSVESSSDNGESDCDTVCTENNESMATQSYSYNNLAAEENSEAVAHFGSISVCNSSDIHFGNKTFYNGPVTIKQFVYSPEQKSDGAASSFKEENVNISQIFRNFNTPEASEITFDNPSRVFSQTSNGGQNCSSLTPQENSKSPNESQKKYFICSCPPLRHFITVLLVAVLIVVLTVLVLKYEKKTETSVVPQHYEPPVVDLPVTGQPSETNFTLSGKLRIMQRREWLAQPAAAPADKLATPVPYVIISHTATEQCVSIAQCILIVRTVQSFHIESKGWDDIGYNFLVGGDGFAYIGRGWDSIGAHSYGYNTKSIGISFMGTFTSVLPPSRQLIAAKQLIEFGVALGKIAEDYKLLAHRQVSATESPGAMLFQELQKWPHWAPNP